MNQNKYLRYNILSGGRFCSTRMQEQPPSANLDKISVESECQNIANNLHPARVKHDTHLLSHSSGRQVRAELCADNTTVSVRAAHFSPDHAVLAAFLAFLSHLVDVRDALAEVEVRRGAIVHVLNLEERSVGVLVPETTLVSKEHSLDVKSSGGARRADRPLAGDLRLLLFLHRSIAGASLVVGSARVSARHVFVSRYSQMEKKRYYLLSYTARV